MYSTDFFKYALDQAIEATKLSIGPRWEDDKNSGENTIWTYNECANCGANDAPQLAEYLRIKKYNALLPESTERMWCIFPIRSTPSFDAFCFGHPGGKWIQNSKVCDILNAYTDFENTVDYVIKELKPESYNEDSPDIIGLSRTLKEALDKMREIVKP